MSLVKDLAVGALLLFHLVSVVSGAVLAGWDMTGVDLDDGVGVVSNIPPYTMNATTTAVAHVDAWLDLGFGVNPTTTAGQYGFKISGADETNTLAGAISSGHYIEISVSIDDGYALSLDSIEIWGEGSSSACSNIALLSNIDGFTEGQEIAVAYSANKTGGFDSDESGFGGPIHLSGAKYQQLEGTVTFRLYGWNSSSGSASSRIRNLTGDDLVLFGDISALTLDEGPSLLLVHTNGMTRISAEFGGEDGSSYMLQQAEKLMASNAWVTVFDQVNVNTNWMFDVTNCAGFFRLVPKGEEM